AGETHEHIIPLRIRLGHRRGGCADDLCRLRHHAVARRVPGADFRSDGLVACRRVGRGDAGLPVHGLCRLLLGCAFRPLRHAHRGAGRQRAARHRARHREPGANPLAVPALLRRRDRHRRRQLLRADDGARQRLDRQAPQPCGGAGLRRHGHVA
ncbi:hypothetical protein KXW38_002055, partial [Aspergillus fumigatus]